MSVAEEITRIKEAKENLKTSINAKLSDSQTKITDELISSYSTFVDNIESGVNINDYFITEGLTSSKYKLLQLIKICPLIDMTGITNVNSMFANCVSLTTIPLLDTSNIKNMSNMFMGCTSLIKVPLLNTSKVTDTTNMFMQCRSLTTIPPLDTSNVTDATQMFWNCPFLTEVPLLNLSKATTTSAMFYSCARLKAVPPFDLSSATHIYSMFSGCTELETVPEFNCPKVINASDMFQSCGSLTEQSLNNILGTCITMTKISSSQKTLRYIGLTSSQATTCEGLSNYQAFLDAGWKTGY